MPNGICAAVDAMLLLSCRGHGARALPFGGGAGALPFGPGALPFGPGAFPFGGGGGAGGRDVRGGTPLDDTPAGCIDWSSGVKAARMPEYLGVSLVCASVGAGAGTFADAAAVAAAAFPFLRCLNTMSTPTRHMASCPKRTCQ